MFAALAITAMMVSDGPQHAVVLLIDDLGYGDTHHMGAEYPTPNIVISRVPDADNSCLSKSFHPNCCHFNLGKKPTGR